MDVMPVDHDEALSAARSFAAFLGRSDEIAEQRMLYVIALAEQAKELAELVRSARPLADPNSPEGLKWMLDARAELARYEESKG